MTAVRQLHHHQLLPVAVAASGGEVLVRDDDLLASAAARPATALFGAEQFPRLLDKAAALLHSVARFHPSWMATSGSPGSPHTPSSHSTGRMWWRTTRRRSTSPWPSRAASWTRSATSQRRWDRSYDCPTAPEP